MSIQSLAKAYSVYMNAIAAIAGPATPLALAYMNAIPQFHCQTQLGPSALLVNLILVGIVLFFRHRLISLTFQKKGQNYQISRGAIILLFILLLIFLLALLGYLYLLDLTLIQVYKVLPDDPMATVGCDEIPGLTLLVLYCVAFGSLQFSFLLMALREYGQVALDIPEKKLIQVK